MADRVFHFSELEFYILSKRFHLLKFTLLKYKILWTREVLSQILLNKWSKDLNIFYTSLYSVEKNSVQTPIYSKKNKIKVVLLDKFIILYDSGP